MNGSPVVIFTANMQPIPIVLVAGYSLLSADEIRDQLWEVQMFSRRYVF
jgi:hypothetical protein